ncbi:MAG: alanine transaminase [Omnitrophica WOR_2 bacterium RIFCSPLOWO2_02_FULL_63_16]|nr:MAG: alanine transaminase [Omnitrophica WOR_2 bacterium GWA2_63_20]OGX16363.1 MAG: alanine transaminase [Omnitrophica WOR_2 bacterium GWF2_63_9]OGX31175.1 MAG: alanine transaminase [Omnitrophica WOR_2 bacterium RIFCSPHIGHO2_12_FULL_64_13]OGX36687.1 MAG: alanine transaminase [Omnitrophica WOR_2 bacterium RIFCSPHIGHO2_02_FULL_63_39]OGX45056.1 MAG: alanine transaminase [Omnitrophica WOR_2 bacterium RIFCSPLOWO2_02_FULL_63_16]OGX50022.1 MAG: alanine transaminase [Omnitrophica WOR_2 bacterium RIF
MERKRNERRLFQEANRLKRLPLYLFTILDDLKAQARAKGVDVIDLGMGNPDLPAPRHVVEELCRQAKRAVNHRYSRPDGDSERRLREAIAQWYFNKFHVSLDPKTEVLPLIGSKEGIAHLSLAFLNHDDITLVPNPAYPVHFNGVIMAGGILYSLPTHEEEQYRPNLKSVNREVLKRSKMLFLSYPHNPTTATVDLKFFREVVEWAHAQRRLMVVHDFAYSDFIYDGAQAPSILQVPEAKQVSVEFHTLSKSYCMAGWRLGFAVGNPDILASLAKTKSYVDFGIFRAIQWAAVEALSGPQDAVTRTVEAYRKRRDVFVGGLRRIGWDVPLPKSTFYIWAKLPLKFSALTSLEFATLLMQEAGVVVAPGSGFGEYGEGYVRFALVEPEPKLRQAVARIEKVLRMED